MARNYREALRWYEQAAQQYEDAHVLYCIGFMHCAARVCGANPKTALRHLRRAALLGEMNAQYEIGLACFRGTAQTKNLRLAMKWLRMRRATATTKRAPSWNASNAASD